MHATTTITFVSVRAFDGQGLRTGAAWLGLYGEQSQLHLPPGRYALVFRRDGVETERRELLVGSEPKRIELQFD